jgi:hypothetical protein
LASPAVGGASVNPEMASLSAHVQRLYDRVMAAQSEAAPAEHTIEAARREMVAMHHAMERGDYAEALAHLKVWAAMLGMDGGYAAPE